MTEKLIHTQYYAQDETFHFNGFTRIVPAGATLKLYIEQEEIMKPTEEQLADPDYWKQHAPEGAYFAWTNKYDPSMFVWSESSTEGCNWWAGSNGMGQSFCGFSPNAWRSIGQRPTTPTWTGEGFPPVGTECEYRRGPHDWRVGSVFGHYVDSQGSVTAFVNLDGGRNWDYSRDPHKFRPIRTPEEVERETVCGKALGIIKQDYSDESVETTHPRTYVINAVEQLYDAGYLRKPMIRQEIFGILDSIMGEEMWPQIKQILDALNIKD